MRSIALCVAILLAATAHAAAPTAKGAAVVADANAPKGKLPDVAAPTAYRLDFTILPEEQRFSGHGEIDVTLKRPVALLRCRGRRWHRNRRP